MSAPSLPEYAPLPPKASAWEDCLDIFYSPREVFERRRDGRFLVPLLVLCLLIGVLSFLGRQAFDAIAELAFREQLAKNGMNAEQVAQAKEFGEKFRTIGYFITPITWAVFGLIAGTVFWALARMLGATLTVAQGITIWTLASYPNLVNTVLFVAQTFVIDPNTITHKHAYAASLARFVPPDAPALVVKLAALVDPFVVWSAVLIGLGAYIIGKMEKERAAVLAIVASVLYVLVLA